MAKSKWTTDLLLKEASKYTTKGAFQKGSKGAYLSARRQNLLELVCKHMQPVRNYWCLESSGKEALKYATRTEFAEKSNGAYTWALNNGAIDDVTKHMKSSSLHWTTDALSKEALKYSKRNDFKKGSSGAYQAACKAGVIDEVCAHMTASQKAWSLQEVEMEAKKYTRRNEFKRNSYGAYQSASRQGVLNDICTHMEYEHSTFNYDNPAYLYYVKIITKDASIPDVYKIGITGRSYILDRFYNDYLVTTTEVVVIHKVKFAKGIDAFNKEQEIKKMYSEYRYNGVSPLVNTKTSEMFASDLQGIGQYFNPCHKDDELLE